MKRLFSAAIFATLFLPMSSAQAIDDHINVVQAGPGTISAQLAGIIDPCQGSHYFPLGVISTVLNGHEFDITSSFAILDPPPCPDVPQPYQLTTSLGNPPDGHYTVVWTLGSLVVTGAFDVGAGMLQGASSPVPTMTPWALWILVTIVGLTGLVLVRGQSTRRFAARSKGSGPSRFRVRKV